MKNLSSALALAFTLVSLEPSIASVIGKTKIKGFEFAPIRHGSFVMGSPLSDDPREQDESPHPVTLSRDFEMQVTTVTQWQWFAILGYNPAYFSNPLDCPGEYLVLQTTPLCPNHPVERVTWDDTQRFIQALNALYDGYVYRLPTEAEFEYAARAGSTGVYGFGSEIARLGEYAWFEGNSRGRSHAVATRKPNAFGLYDMQGNVWQWVQDQYSSYPATAVTDPLVTDPPVGHVFRGGAWGNAAPSLRVANRNHDEENGPSVLLGFRLVRTKAVPRDLPVPPEQ